MTQELATGALPVSEWMAESLRLTAFLSSPVDVAGLAWWSEVVGEKPDDVNTREKQGECQQIGQVGNARLVLVVKQTRVDWLLTPAEVSTPESTAPPILADAMGQIERFPGMMRHWFDKKLPIKRLAFGVVLVVPVEGREQGYKMLSGHLPFTLDPETSSEFLYRINRPRKATKSGMPELKLNRLATWTVMKLQQVVIPLVPAGQQVVQTGEFFGCRLELDVNTSGDHEGSLPQEKVPQLFEELVSIAVETAKKGDVS